MKKFCLKVHRYLALPFGVFISIACFTGLMMLLTKEAAAWFNWDTAEMPFYNAVKQLHRWLFMKPAEPHGGLSVGRVIMAASAMAMSLVLLSGVVIWWPKNKKMLKNRLTVTTNKGFRRFVYDSHVSLGIYAFVFLFLMAVTGPVFSFGWYKKGMSTLLGQSSEKKEMPMTPNAAPVENAPETAAAHATAAPQDSKDTPAQADGKDKKKDKKSGGKKFFKSLHKGTWGGWASMTLYALAALIGGFLPISGYYMWWKRTQGRKGKA